MHWKMLTWYIGGVYFFGWIEKAKIFCFFYSAKSTLLILTNITKDKYFDFFYSAKSTLLILTNITKDKYFGFFYSTNKKNTTVVNEKMIQFKIKSKNQ